MNSKKETSMQGLKKELGGKLRKASSKSKQEKHKDLNERLKSELKSLKTFKGKKLKNFRLDDEDRTDLNSIVDRIQKVVTHKKISETIIIRALIKEGTRMPESRLIKRLREIL